MSRSKEGKDSERQDRQNASTTQPDTTGMRQSRIPEKDNYTWGRESRREFPRRSTTRSEQPNQPNNEWPSRRASSEYGRGYDETQRDYRHSDVGPYGSRRPARENQERGYLGDLGDRVREGEWRERRYTQSEPYRNEERGYSSRNEPGSYRQSHRSRIEYDDSHRGRDYNRGTDYTDYNNRYDLNRPADRAPNYARTEPDYRDADYRNQNYRESDYRDDRYTTRSDRDTFDGRSEDYGLPAFQDPVYGSFDEVYMWGSGYGRGPLNCGDIMTRDVTTCQLQTPLRDVAEKMEDEDVGSIPVVDENDRLIGIITDRDIVCRVLAEGRDTRTATAADSMSQDIVSVTREESIIDAIHKMADSQVRRLPVVDQNYRLRGIISMADIALEAERNLELANALEHISQPAPFRSRRR